MFREWEHSFDMPLSTQRCRCPIVRRYVSMTSPSAWPDSQIGLIWDEAVVPLFHLDGRFQGKQTL